MRYWMALIGLALVACGAAEPTSEPRLLLEVSPVNLDIPAPDSGSLPVAVGVFLSVHDSPSIEPTWGETDVAGRIDALITEANGVLGQCGLHLEVEAAQVIALSRRLMSIRGNERGSYGGHPPNDVEDPALFNYQQNDRLTDETRDLFTYGKQFTSPNAIGIFTVEHITYFIGNDVVGAGGLSFSPNRYHLADDYPYRNSVLLVAEYPSVGSLPVTRGRTLEHEIAHMLLNTGLHEGDQANLLMGGTNLTPQQCTTMQNNRQRLFGNEAVPDPGPPLP